MFDLGVSRTSTKDAVLKLLLKANPTWTNEEKEQMEARAANEINCLITRVGSWGQYIWLCQRGKELTEEESLKAKTNIFGSVPLTLSSFPGLWSFEPRSRSQGRRCQRTRCRGCPSRPSLPESPFIADVMFE